MLVKFIVYFISFAVGTTASGMIRSPVERLRYLSEQISYLLPPSVDCRPDPVKPEDRQSIVESMIKFVQSEDSELDSFISVLSRARSCGLAAIEIDSYKWDVLSALMSLQTRPADGVAHREEPSELQKRPLEDNDAVPSKKSRQAELPEVRRAVVEETTTSTTAEPPMTPNLSPAATEGLLHEIKSYTKKFSSSDMKEPVWGYLRSLQGLRASKMDFAAIREDFNMLEDLGLKSREIANVFGFAYNVMIRGGPAVPIRPLKMPDYVAREIQKPLIERLDAIYERCLKWSKDNDSRISHKLVEYVRDGSLDRIANALNLAQLSMVARKDIAEIFYKAYKAMGGRY